MKKRCSRCDLPKELSEFPKDKSKKDGHYPVCKPCRSPLANASYAANREQIRDRAKERYAADPEPHREASRQFRKNNPEYMPKYLKGYYAKNRPSLLAKYRTRYWADPTKSRAASQAYRDADPERARAGVRDWFRRNRHAARLQGFAYRMRLLKAENTLTPAQIDETLEFFDHKCGYCLVDLRTLPKEFQTLDHLLPIIRGGSNIQENVIPCCKSCNSRKGSRHIALMVRYL